MTQLIPEGYKPIQRAPGYHVSPSGGVVNKFGMSIKGYRDAAGYCLIKLKSSDGVRRTSSIHRLVCETFIGPIPKGYWVNHKDGVKNNNNLENLEIGTPSYNHQHARDVLKRRWASGEETSASKLDNEARAAIDALASLGWSQHRIAAALYVSQSAICQRLKKRKTSSTSSPSPC